MQYRCILCLKTWVCSLLFKPPLMSQLLAAWRSAPSGVIVLSLITGLNPDKTWTNYCFSSIPRQSPTPTLPPWNVFFCSVISCFDGIYISHTWKSCLIYRTQREVVICNSMFVWWCLLCFSCLATIVSFFFPKVRQIREKRDCSFHPHEKPAFAIQSTFLSIVYIAEMT